MVSAVKEAKYLWQPWTLLLVTVHLSLQSLTFNSWAASILDFLFPAVIPSLNLPPAKPVPYNAALTDLRNLLDSLGYAGKN